MKIPEKDPQPTLVTSADARVLSCNAAARQLVEAARLAGREVG